MSWPDDHAEALRRYAAEGRSGGEMVKMLRKEFGANYSRNACIGKVHRMGLQRGAEAGKLAIGPNTRAAVSKPKPKPAILIAGGAVYTQPTDLRPPRSAIREEAFFALPKGDPVKLVDLHPLHCRWPLGDVDSPSFGFCGVRREGAGPYCCEHEGVAYAPNQPAKVRPYEAAVGRPRRAA